MNEVCIEKTNTMSSKIENKPKTLHCKLINARSVVNKLNDLHIMFDSENPDIVGITESWATKDISDSELSINGYTIYRRDREHAKGGGVMLYVKDSLNTEVIIDYTHRDVESLFCKIGKGKCAFYIGVFYRPPNSTKCQDEALFAQFGKMNKPRTVLMGDFNMPNIDWDTMSADGPSSSFRDMVLDNFLHQRVRLPTRNNNILDLVFESEENLVHNVDVAQPLGNSDHFSVNFQVKSNPNCSTKNERLNYRRANIDAMKTHLKSIKWAEVFERKTLNQCWRFLLAIMTNLVNNYVPLQKDIKRKGAAWMTAELRSEVKRKNAAWRKFKNDESPENLQAYKTIEKSMRMNIRKRKRNFEKELANNMKTNPKKFYSYVNKKVNKSNIGPLKVGDNILTEDREIVDELNTFFVSVFTKENTEAIPTVESQTHKTLEAIVIDEQSVLKEIDKIKETKAPGPDKLSPYLLKKLKENLAEPLTIIYNRSLQECEVPTDWKKANITPIFKKGSKQSPGNYRPISLTSIPGKILESIVKREITKHLEQNNLIYETQHGFRSGKSCLTNLLEYLEYVSNEMDNRNPVDVIYLDFSKAFDKVPHKRLIEKVKSLGIGRNLAAWIENWLTKREQRVVLNGSQSKWATISSGVPQGSVLGPLLFLIYVNDMEKNIDTQISKFADDTKLFGRASSDNQCAAIQMSLNSLIDWSEKWQMSFNTEKCKVLHFGNNNKKYKYKMGENELQSTNCERDLGVHIQCDFKKDTHIDYVVKKANRVLGMIRRTIEYKNKDNIIPLYTSLVRPHLEYCVQAWAPHLKKDIDKLENVQKRALNVIPNLRHLSYEDKLRHLDLFSLRKRRLRGDLIETFKIMKGIDRIDPRNFFQEYQSRTRGHNKKLYKKCFRCDNRKYFFTQRVVEDWNKLPQEAVDSESISVFKKRLDKYFINNNIL